LGEKPSSKKKRDLPKEESEGGGWGRAGKVKKKGGRGKKKGGRSKGEKGLRPKAEKGPEIQKGKRDLSKGKNIDRPGKQRVKKKLFPKEYVSGTSKRKGLGKGIR